MVLIAHAMRNTNDNEDPFQPLAIAVARLTKDLEEQRSENERKTKPGEEIDKQRERERFVETRLREIDRFERRVSGQDRPRRKRN